MQKCQALFPSVFMVLGVGWRTAAQKYAWYFTRFRQTPGRIFLTATLHTLNKISLSNLNWALRIVIDALNPKIWGIFVILTVSFLFLSSNWGNSQILHGKLSYGYVQRTCMSLKGEAELHLDLSLGPGHPFTTGWSHHKKQTMMNPI